MLYLKNVGYDVPYSLKSENQELDASGRLSPYDMRGIIGPVL